MTDDTQIQPRPFAERVAYKILALVTELQAARNDSTLLFRVYSLPDRLVVAFNTDAIDLGKVGAKFVHFLSTRLEGRRVEITNSRGLYFQIARKKPAVEILPEAQPLDFAQQTTPWHIPVGATAKGPLWISLPDADSILIGGSRGRGKSGMTHGVIQALLNGGQTEVWAADGKRGAEFGRYLGALGFRFMANPRKELETLSLQLAGRLDTLRKSGYPNILHLNQSGKDFLKPIALVVDEIADLDDDVKEMLKGMVKLYRAAGMFPILATNDPVQSSILVKTNLVTRIAFGVPSFVDSLTILGQRGAESLPQTPVNEPGRGLLVWRGKLTEFQAFRVTYPEPTEETQRLLSAVLTEAEGQRQEPAQNSVQALAESIRHDWQPGMSKSDVARLFGKTNAGGWSYKIDQIIEYLSSTTAQEGHYWAVEA